MEYAKEELDRAKDQLRDLRRGKLTDRTRSFWEAELEGSDLTGMAIASNSNAFQLASFRNCKLEFASLKGGTASFQSACFDEANLKGANLSGDTASFQGSTFVSADLTGATLTGGRGSFQGASFEDATMIDTKWVGNFQRVNINAVKLQGADLSAIDSNNLASCYFDLAPTYDAKTKFPTGFDPREHLWRMAD